jgi:hypothetical protein
MNHFNFETRYLFDDEDDYPVLPVKRNSEQTGLLQVSSGGNNIQETIQILNFKLQQII